MLQTYKARLHGTHIEWVGEIPFHLQDGQSVHITVLDDSSVTTDTSQGSYMATLLDQLAQQHGTSIADPSAWQQDIRSDNPLPDREA